MKAGRQALGTCAAQPWHMQLAHPPPPLAPMATAPADVAQAVRESEFPDSPYLQPLGSGSGTNSTLGFFVPPPFAIAHHIMRRWAEHGGPWFSGEQQGQQPGLRQAAPAANL